MIFHGDRARACLNGELHPRRGESCATAVCGDDSFCDPTTKICSAPQVNGAPCIGDSFCATGYCDFDTNTCAERPICL